MVGEEQNMVSEEQNMVGHGLQRYAACVPKHNCCRAVKPFRCWDKDILPTLPYAPSLWHPRTVKHF